MRLWSSESWFSFEWMTHWVIIWVMVNLFQVKYWFKRLTRLLIQSQFICLKRGVGSSARCNPWLTETLLKWRQIFEGIQSEHFLFPQMAAHIFALVGEKRLSDVWACNIFFTEVFCFGGFLRTGVNGHGWRSADEQYLTVTPALLSFLWTKSLTRRQCVPFQNRARYPSGLTVQPHCCSAVCYTGILEFCVWK